MMHLFYLAVNVLSVNLLRKNHKPMIVYPVVQARTLMKRGNVFAKIALLALTNRFRAQQDAMTATREVTAQ
jgi:hypothetical protein